MFIIIPKEFGFVQTAGFSSVFFRGFTFIVHRCSFSVEASNPLTSFVDFGFKDSLFEEKNWRNSHFGFTKLNLSKFVLPISCELRLF